MLRLSMHADLNKVAGGLTLDEEKALLKTVPSLHREAQADLLRYFGGVKKQAKVLEWVLAGEAKVVSFSPEYRVIELKSKDGRCHRVELF